MDLSIGLAVLVLLLLTSFLIFRKKKKLTAKRQLEQLIADFKRDEVKSIIIPDGIGGLLEIEQVILLDQGLLLIETYAMAGNLFGAEKIDQWTQVIEGRSYKFVNPLHHIQTSKHALSILVPNVPIFCKIIFNGDAHFPKGKPQDVSVLETIVDDMQDILSSPKLGDKVQTAWDKCMRIARKNGQAVLRGGES